MKKSIKTSHYISAIIVTIFVAAHLFNHLCSLLGAEQHIAIMQQLRLVYRHKLFEGMLLGAVLWQIGSGISLFIAQMRASRARTLSPVQRIQMWTGAYMAFFLLAHLSAVFVGRYVAQLDTNFYFGVAGLNTFPLNLFFIPYYSLAILAFFGHLAAIHAQKMQHFVGSLSPHQQAKIIFGLGVCLNISLLYGLTNGFKGVSIPTAYQLLTVS